jgi:hypothetical protein
MLGALRDDPTTRREFLAVIGDPTSGQPHNDRRRGLASRLDRHGA